MIELNKIYKHYHGDFMVRTIAFAKDESNIDVIIFKLVKKNKLYTSPIDKFEELVQHRTIVPCYEILKPMNEQIQFYHGDGS